VAWCQRAVSTRWRHFHFHHVDLQSGAYHRRGKNDGAQFVFPLADAGVDVAFAGSLFTHLLPPVARQYLHECGRVLASGGTCVASFFLLNDETRAGIHRDASFMSFDHAVDGGRCLIHDPEVPEAATALDEAWVVEELADAGLRVVDIRRGGWWSGRSHDQDVVTAVRTRAPAR
jgi:SAM-dependent methyltransferase